jgi:hypothetical protein
VSTIVYRACGRKWILPQVVSFEGIVLPKRSWTVDGQFGAVQASCFYEIDGYRPPRQGEWYLSGATVAAWHAKADMGDAYLVVRPTHHVAETRTQARGPKVETSGVRS